MRTFWIQTLGCKVNHYESEQLRGLLTSRGLIESASAGGADLRIVHSCSVTTEAASKSRSAVRRAVRLTVLPGDGRLEADASTGACSAAVQPGFRINIAPALETASAGASPHRVIVTGCWATSDPQAAAMAGADAVLGHDCDVAAELDRLLLKWTSGDSRDPAEGAGGQAIAEPDAAAVDRVDHTAPLVAGVMRTEKPRRAVGMTALPLLGQHQDARQRAFLKVQDGCDAHCTYCIIPKLRSTVWSKPVDEAVAEARRLVAAGHSEIVLTGIFLGAYGQATALRRRQRPSGSGVARLIDALCAIDGLARLRLSSLEPGDLTDDLLKVLAAHRQTVPHFHLPLQSGSDEMLRRMNRQYSRDDFLAMVDRVKETFDRPALTTDIIVGFPGETAGDFEQTLDVVNRSGFIHIHAFPFSARPGTAAARWRADFVSPPITRRRIEALEAIAKAHGVEYRRQFIGQTVELLVERDGNQIADPHATRRHGRCERYFDVEFDGSDCRTGDLVKVRVETIAGEKTLGTLASNSRAAAGSRNPA
jgi:threonylcarbamoyladenosine tRNA methylthiotransferase MtaB